MCIKDVYMGAAPGVACGLRVYITRQLWDRPDGCAAKTLGGCGRLSWGKAVAGRAENRGLTGWGGGVS